MITNVYFAADVMAFIESVQSDFLAEIVKDIIFSIPRGIKKTLDRWRFQKFFGPAALAGLNIYAVFDPYELARDSFEVYGPIMSVSIEPIISSDTGLNRYIKRFLGRKPDQGLIGESKILGVNIVRVVSYVSGLFARYRQGTQPIHVVTDEEIVDKWDGTFICFGSSDSNIKTYDIEILPEQSFYTFEFGPDGHRRFNVGGRVFTISGLKDYGILLRLKNPRHPEHFLFICAGLGAYGTSGAAYYLCDRWKELYKKHKKGEFCMVIEVDVGSDESVREVHSLAK